MTASVTPSNTAAVTPTVTPSNTSTPTQTPQATVTSTPEVTPTNTPTQTVTPTAQATSTPLPTQTTTPTQTVTPSNTPEVTNTVTPTVSPSLTPSVTPSTVYVPMYFSACCDSHVYRINLTGAEWNAIINALEEGNPSLYLENQTNFIDGCVGFIGPSYGGTVTDLGNKDGDFLIDGGQPWTTTDPLYARCSICEQSYPCVEYKFVIQEITYFDGNCTPGGTQATATLAPGFPSVPSIGEYCSITSKGGDAPACWQIIGLDESPEPATYEIDVVGPTCSFCALPTPTPSPTPTVTPSNTPAPLSPTPTPTVTRSATPTRTPTKTPTPTPSTSVSPVTISLNYTSETCARGFANVYVNGVLQSSYTATGSGNDSTDSIQAYPGDTILYYIESQGVLSSGCQIYGETQGSASVVGQSVPSISANSGFTPPNDSESFTLGGNNISIGYNFVPQAL